MHLVFALHLFSYFILYNLNSLPVFKIDNCVLFIKRNFGSQSPKLKKKIFIYQTKMKIHLTSPWMLPCTLKGWEHSYLGNLVLRDSQLMYCFTSKLLKIFYRRKLLISKKFWEHVLKYYIKIKLWYICCTLKYDSLSSSCLLSFINSCSACIK